MTSRMKTVTCHSFDDDGEVSLAVSQGYVAASCSQVSYSLQVAPSWLDELSGVSCSNNKHIISDLEINYEPFLNPIFKNRFFEDARSTSVQTCDPDGRLHHIVATPRLLGRHQPISAEGQSVVVAGHQVPGDGAGGRPRKKNQKKTKMMRRTVQWEKREHGMTCTCSIIITMIDYYDDSLDIYAVMSPLM